MMTPDERETLLDMLLDTKVEYADGGDGSTEFDDIICHYVDDLLAKRDIKILKNQPIYRRRWR